MKKTYQAITDVARYIKYNRMANSELMEEYLRTDDAVEKKRIYSKMRRCYEYEDGIETVLHAFGFEIVEGDDYLSFDIIEM